MEGDLGFDLSWGAIVGGILCGFAGFAPLMFVSRKRFLLSLKVNPIALGLLGVGFSLVFMLACLLVCREIALESLPVFGVSLAASFLVATGIYAGVSWKRMIS